MLKATTLPQSIYLKARYSHHTKALSPIVMEVLALSTMQLITKRFYMKQTTLTLTELAEKMKVSDGYLDDILTVLQAHHFISTNADRPPCYILSCAAEDVKISEVKVAISQGDQSQQKLMQDLLDGNQLLASYHSDNDVESDMSLKDFAIAK